jgi:hypothetical protein
VLAFSAQPIAHSPLKRSVGLNTGAPLRSQRGHRTSIAGTTDLDDYLITRASHASGCTGHEPKRPYVRLSDRRFVSRSKPKQQPRTRGCPGD